MSQVIPTLTLGLVIEARYVLKSKFWITINYGFNKYVFSLVWIASLLLMAISEIQIVQFLSGEKETPPNSTLITLGITFAFISIALNPIIEIAIRVFNKTIALIATKIPYQYIRFLNFCWRKNISPSKRFFSYRNRRMESRLKRLEILIVASRNLAHSNPNIKYRDHITALESISLELTELRRNNLETKEMLSSPKRYNLEHLDQEKMQQKINKLSERLSNYW
jgi:hypothetical protein